MSDTEANSTVEPSAGPERASHRESQSVECASYLHQQQQPDRAQQSYPRLRLQLQPQANSIASLASNPITSTSTTVRSSSLSTNNGREQLHRQRLLQQTRKRLANNTSANTNTHPNRNSSNPHSTITPTSNRHLNNGVAISASKAAAAALRRMGMRRPLPQSKRLRHSRLNSHKRVVHVPKAPSNTTQFIMADHELLQPDFDLMRSAIMTHYNRRQE